MSAMFYIELPFPPASLSGHAKGYWRGKSSVTKQYRDLAHKAAGDCGFTPPASGDIEVYVIFEPADKRGDRVNFPNRMKPYFDGIADALGVNDSRFLPHFQYRPAAKPGCVKVLIGGISTPAEDSIGEAARRAVLGIIDRQTDPATRKSMIVRAAQTGHIGSDEAEDWIAAEGLAAA